MNVPPLPKRFWFIRRLYRLRHRLMAFFIMFVGLFVFHSDNFGLPSTVASGYSFSIQTFIANKIDYSPETNKSLQIPSNIVSRQNNTGGVVRTYFNSQGEVITDSESLAYYSGGFIFNPPFVDLDSISSVAEVQQLSINDLIPPPTQPQNKNLLVYYGDGYEVRVPIIFSNLDDLYNRNSLGEIDYRSPKDTYSLSSPIQLKLEQGVVHMANSPVPGEVGNSYIVGHSSNYSSINSAYNTIFKPLMFRSKAGEKFVIYDSVGRKLNFKVFESLQIPADDVVTAYSVDKFKDRRVVTLQTSVLTQQGVTWVATHRWLTRGELILE